MEVVEIQCPHGDCFPERWSGWGRHGFKRKYEAVKVGDKIECSHCRQPFVVTQAMIVRYWPAGTPVAYIDREGVPLKVPTAQVEAWKEANWPGYREKVRRAAVRDAAEGKIEVISAQGVKPEYFLSVDRFIAALVDAGWEIVRREMRGL